tara:strand:- start:683 stop:805 length:123 start_codon:yes stop_codon:yes gene_type:complete
LLEAVLVVFLMVTKILARVEVVQGRLFLELDILLALIHIL